MLMEYKGIRYTLRLGIERNKWLVGVHPFDAAVIERKVIGNRAVAEKHAKAMIDDYQRTRQQQRVFVPN